MHKKRRNNLEWNIMTVDSEKKECVMHTLAKQSSNVQQ